MSRRRRLAMVNRGHPGLSVVKQCRLLQLSRSAVYYRPTPTNPADLDLMAGMDRQYLNTPFYGSRRSLCQMLWKLPPGGLAHQAATAPSALTGNSVKIPSSNRAPSISKPIRFLPPFSGRQRSLSLSDTLNTRYNALSRASSFVEWRPSSTSQR